MQVLVDNEVVNDIFSRKRDGVLYKFNIEKPTIMLIRVL